MRILVPLFTLALTAGPALAADPVADVEGTPLVVTVVDSETGMPIPFASVRETQEKELHPVNRATGQFATTVLYPSYNDEIPLQPGMELTLEVTAANYAPVKVDYTMRKRKNKVMIRMEPMQVDPNWGDEPVWQFARDRPIGGKEISPEELARIEAEAEAARQERESEEEDASE